MKIFLTGASGTLGGYVIRELLQAGYEIVEYSRTPPAMEGITFIQGDIMDEETLQKSIPVGCDAVIHMAAIPGPGRARPSQMMNINVTGTVNVLEAALAADVRKFVFPSSCAATGFCFQKTNIQPLYLPLDEDHPDQPHDEYGLSKLLGELACKRYSDAFGMKTICLRVNNSWYLDREGAETAIGHGWARKMSSFEQLWKERYRKTIQDPEGEWPTPGPPAPHKILWAVTDSRDTAQAFRLAVENTEVSHGVFNIVGADTCSMEKTEDLLKRYYPEVPLKEPLEGHKSPWSWRKAAKTLGYQPRYTWRNGDFANWLKENPLQGKPA